MRILALEPYYGGSHRAFVDGLSKASRHDWTLLTLPAHKWKWRMRHSAITFARRVADLCEHNEHYDLLFSSDMLNLAEFVGLVPLQITSLSKVIYFHENQLTYPVRVEDERDCHFAMTNFTSTLAADAVWFNSHFHMESFLGALAKFLKSMPDHQPVEAIEKIRAKSSVHPPGITDMPSRQARKPGPLRILWAARWEHDKNPEDFFAALGMLKTRNVPFRVSVIGQSFQDYPEVFDRAGRELADRIDLWGYQESRNDYLRAIGDADVVVSTANHEFYGIAIVEAIAAGAYPLVPDRLSYPEILGLGRIEGVERFFYNGTAGHLANKLSELAREIEGDTLALATVTMAAMTEHLRWHNLACRYDEAIKEVRLSAQ
jgi:glycosyltransferase involved in cell wall biosynthesis